MESPTSSIPHVSPDQNILDNDNILGLVRFLFHSHCSRGEFEREFEVHCRITDPPIGNVLSVCNLTKQRYNTFCFVFVSFVLKIKRKSQKKVTISCQVAHFVRNCQPVLRPLAQLTTELCFRSARCIQKTCTFPWECEDTESHFIFLTISVECLKASAMISCEEMVCLKKRV